MKKPNPESQLLRQGTRPLQRLRERAKRLRDSGLWTKFKILSENSGAVGLVLSLVLACLTLYDVLVSKPAAERIVALTQFNQAVSAAAKIRQDLAHQMQGVDPRMQVVMQSMATPRILSEVATAKAVMPNLPDEDIGMPQLSILIFESMTAGDPEGMKGLVDRAVGKRNLTPYMAAEARRYQGKYFFVAGRPQDARKSYLEADKLLGTHISVSVARAYNLADLISTEYALGFCDQLESNIEAFVALVNVQGVAAENRAQLASGLANQLGQYTGQKCPTPPNLSKLVQGAVPVSVRPPLP